MKIIFFGTPEFSNPSLKALFKDPEIEILAVITQKDKPVGRKQTLTPPPVKALAKDLGLKVIQGENTKELETKLSTFEADFYVVIAFGMILNSKLLKLPKYGAINVHASLLPKYRGASPIQESILNGDKETGISIIKIDEKLDHGDIFLIRRLEIEPDDNYETLSIKLANLSAKILPFILRDIYSGNLTGIPQNHEKATFCRKISKDDGEINWQHTAKEINNLIRAYTPWPSAYTTLEGKKLKILKAKIGNENIKPGKIIIEKNLLKIGTKEGSLIPEIAQMEGKNPIDIKSFINGHKNKSINHVPS